LDLVELFVSSTGRIGRWTFALAAAVLMALGEGFASMPHTLAHRIAGWPVYCTLLFCAACLMSKRFHDRGQAGWWGFLPVFAVIAVWPWPDGGASQAVWDLILAATFFNLVVLAGDKAGNRFGPGRPKRTRS
jgi:uncharacterized membrane protein YhaH (DUF805 family)